MATELSTTNMSDPPPMSGLMTFATGGPCRGDEAKASRAQYPAPGEIAYRTAESRNLRAEVERLRAERDRLQDTQARILELLGTTQPDRLLHDLRNMLNERALFRALAETVM